MFEISEELFAIKIKHALVIFKTNFCLCSFIDDQLFNILIETPLNLGTAEITHIEYVFVKIT